MGISSIGGKRAFVAGGAQVRLKASAGGSGTRPYEIQGTLRSFRRGRPAGGLWPRTSSVTLCVTPSPKGEGFRATARVALTPGNGPGALVRQSQARLWNRIRPKFLHTQGPVARIEWQKATQILRAENPTPSQRGNPRNGGPGVSGPMGTKCPSAASPGDPLVSFPSLGKKLAARRRRNARNETALSSPPHPPPSGAPSPQGEGFWGRSPPHPPRMRSAPSPQGEGLYEGIMKKVQWY